jgi:hypothetical protein
MLVNGLFWIAGRRIGDLDIEAGDLSMTADPKHTGLSSLGRDGCRSPIFEIRRNNCNLPS